MPAAVCISVPNNDGLLNDLLGGSGYYVLGDDIILYYVIFHVFGELLFIPISFNFDSAYLKHSY